MNKIYLIQQISNRTNWAHEIPLYTFLNDFSIDSLEIINGFGYCKFTDFISFMNHKVISWRECDYKYYKEVEKMNYKERDLLVKLFSKCYIDNRTSRNQYFVWRLFSKSDKLDLKKIEYISKRISEFDFKFSDMSEFYDSICDCAKNKDITVDDLESIFDLTTKIVKKNDKKTFKIFNYHFDFSMFNFELEKEKTDKLMNLFNDIKILNCKKKVSEKDYKELEDLLNFVKNILKPHNIIDEVQFNLIIQEWKQLSSHETKNNFIELIEKEKFSITNGDDIYLMRKLISQTKNNVYLEYMIFNHESFKSLPFEKRNFIIDKLSSYKSEHIRNKYAEKIMVELNEQSVKTAQSVINFDESITLGELLDNISLKKNTRYIDNSIDLGYKEMNNQDIEEIINNFRDDNGDVDLERPIYYVTKNKVKTKKEN